MRNKVALIFICFIFLLINSNIVSQEGISQINWGDDKMYVELHLKDFKSEPLFKEKVTITCEELGYNQEFQSDSRGVVKFIGYINNTYEVSFKYDKYYYTIDMPVRKSNNPIIKKIIYEGTEVVEEMISKRKEEEDEARKRWGVSNAISFKRTLNKYSSPDFDYRDKSVLEVLKRNPQWKDKLIVADITGSMYPYIGQVLLWFKLNYENEGTTKLVFFNDGDSKPDNKKEIGNTGGIYYCEYCDTSGLVDTMIKAMIGGCGGDGPENDLEAIIKSENKIEKFKELILVADNNSLVKDFELLDSIKTPVRIIVCGAFDRVSTEYLDIAYKTKGSVHTIEQDLYNLIDLKNGMKIKIGNRIYRLRKGKFVLTGMNSYIKKNKS